MDFFEQKACSKDPRFSYEWPSPLPRTEPHWRNHGGFAGAFHHAVQRRWRREVLIADCTAATHNAVNRRKLGGSDCSGISNNNNNHNNNNNTTTTTIR